MVYTNVAGDPSYRKKTTKGRKKIEIKKIVENNSRQVTFSKRRTGLFKKASELCVLTGAQIAILVSSPGGRVYTCGHPNADAIIDRYLSDTNDKDNNKNDTDGVRKEQQAPPLARAEKESVEKYTQQLPERFNQHYMVISHALEQEKRRKQMIPSSSRAVAWYDEPVDGLSEGELRQYLYSLEKLKKKVITRVDELRMIQKSPALSGPKMFDLGWNNNNIQMMNVIPPNNVVHGGFTFHGGNIGRF